MAATLDLLASAFPQMSVSIGPGDDSFRSVLSAWNADDGEIDRFLDYQACFAEGMDLRTKAAHLIAFYSHQLALVAVGFYLTTGRVADLKPQSLLMRFEPIDPADAVLPLEVWRFHFRFVDDFLPEDGDALDQLHEAFVSHLRPVIAELKRRTGFSDAAQWRLAADSLAGAFLELGRALGREADAIEMALDLVSRDGSPLLSPDLRFETIEATIDDRRVRRTFRLRGGCCLFYRTRDGRMCDSCVLLDRESQRARLRSFMEGGAGR
jgi:hypothetical protein